MYYGRTTPVGPQLFVDERSAYPRTLTLRQSIARRTNERFSRVLSLSRARWVPGRRFDQNTKGKLTAFSRARSHLMKSRFNRLRPISRPCSSAKLVLGQRLKDELNRLSNLISRSRVRINDFYKLFDLCSFFTISYHKIINNAESEKV